MRDSDIIRRLEAQNKSLDRVAGVVVDHENDRMALLTTLASVPLFGRWFSKRFIREAAAERKRTMEKAKAVKEGPHASS